MCWILNLFLKFCKLKVQICHISKCLDAPVLCTCHHHNVISLIQEQLSIITWGILKHEGYKCYDLSLKKMYISRDVRFIEDISYFSTTNQREDHFKLFLLISSSFIDQGPCSLQHQSISAETNYNSDSPTSKQVLLVTFNVSI